MVGRTYLAPEQENGARYRVRIIEQIKEADDARYNHPDFIKFRAISGDGLVEDIVTYRQLLDKLEDENGTDDEWHFRSIDNHEGPLKQSNLKYNGSQWNVKITWEDRSTIWEPLSIIAKSDLCNLW